MADAISDTHFTPSLIPFFCAAPVAQPTREVTVSPAVSVKRDTGFDSRPLPHVIPSFLLPLTFLSRFSPHVH